MSETANEFTDLLNKVRNGDQTAMGELLERYSETVRRTARALLGSALQPHLESMDLVQSIHRALLVGLRDQKFAISTPDQFIALAGTLLRRKVARHWRKLKNEPGVGTPQGGERSIFSEPTDPETGPAEITLQNEQVRRILATLDDVDRRLLELRLQGHSTADAAKLLGVDAGLLRVRLGRLRRRLRDEGVFDEWV